MSTYDAIRVVITSILCVIIGWHLKGLFDLFKEESSQKFKPSDLKGLQLWIREENGKFVVTKNETKDLDL